MFSTFGILFYCALDWGKFNLHWCGMQSWCTSHLWLTSTKTFLFDMRTLLLSGIQVWETFHVDFFVWLWGWFGFLWIGVTVALGFDINTTFLCFITFWGVFVDGFGVLIWPGIIISRSNGVGPCFFRRESCGRMIICDRLLGEWKFK